MKFSIGVILLGSFVVSAQLPSNAPSSAPSLQVSPISLAFNFSPGGDLPAPQLIAVTSTGTNAVRSTFISMGRQPNTPSPFSLTVNPLSGTTPALLLVSVGPNIQFIQPQEHAEILVNDIPIPVSLTFFAAPPFLTVSPPALNFSAHVTQPGTFVKTLIVGGGELNFNVSLDVHASWIAINPTKGSAQPNQPALIDITVNTEGLGVGGYQNSITIYSPDGFFPPIVVPVLVFVADAGPIIGIDGVGHRFETQQGIGTSESIPV